MYDVVFMFNGQMGSLGGSFLVFFHLILMVNLCHITLIVMVAMPYNSNLDGSYVI